MKKRALLVLSLVVVLAASVAIVIMHGQARRSMGEREPGDGQLPASRTERRAKALADIRDKLPDPVRPPIPRPPPVPADAPAVEDPDAPALSEAVRAVIGLGESRDYATRAAALKGLTRRLSGADEKALTAFLLHRFTDTGEISLIEYNSVRNDVLSVLLQQYELPEGIGRRIVQMYRDRRNDVVWRDYCVQFMAQYCEERWRPGTDLGEENEFGEILDAYKEALEERDSTIAGTALIGLDRLSQDYAGIDEGVVASNALAIASDDGASEAVRITAFSLCGRLGVKDALESARIMAQTGETAPLRMAAAAAVGELGGAGDAELLEALAADGDKRVGKMAASALERLKARVEGASGG